MGKEAALWSLVREALAPFADLERVENRVHQGTPDVNYCLHGGRGEGWIELKDVEAWPTRAETVLKIEHVTEAQKDWWRRRASAGGNIFVLLRVSRPTREYLLWDGPTAARVLGMATATILRAEARVRGGPELPKAHILQQLSGSQK